MEITFLGDLVGKVYALRVEEDRFTDGSKCFMAWCPEMQGCKAQGYTAQEAIANLQDARADFIWVLQQLGEPVPAPNSHLPITR